MIALFTIEDVNSKAIAPGSGQAWLAESALPEDRRARRCRRHLLQQLERAGYDVIRGPAPADVVVALRDRVQTLKDMG